MAGISRYEKAALGLTVALKYLLSEYIHLCYALQDRS